MSHNDERDAIQQNIKDAREGIRRDLDKLDGRIDAIKETATSKVTLVAAGVAALGFVLAFAPRAIKRLFSRRGPGGSSKRGRSSAKGSRAGVKKPNKE